MTITRPELLGARPRGRFLAGAVCALVTVLLVGQAALSARLLEVPGYLQADGTERLLGLQALALLAVVALAALVPVALLRRAVLAVSLLALLAVVAWAALSGVLWSLVVGAWLWLSWWATGRAALTALQPELQRATLVAAALGMGLTGTVTLLLGRAGLIHLLTLGVVLVAGGVAGLRVLWTLGRPRVSSAWTSRPVARTTACVVMLAMVQVALMSTWTAAPEIQYDALYFKAWLPRVWASSGDITSLVEHPVLNAAGLPQYLAVPGHLVGAPAVGRHLQLLALPFLAMGLWQLPGSRYRGGSLLAVVVLLSAPHVLWQTSTAYDDLLLAVLALALATAVLRSRGLAERSGTSVLLGLLAGGVLAGKLHMAAFAVVVPLVWSLSGLGWSARLRRAAGVLLGAAVVALPRPLALLATTGNPVFPQLNHVFKSDLYPPVDERYNFPFTQDGSLVALLRLPVSSWVEPGLMLEAVPPAVMGLLVVALFAGLVLGWRGGREHVAVHAGLLAAFLLWWVELRYLRYLLPYAVVALALLAAQANSTSRGSTPASSRVQGFYGLAAGLVILSFGAPTLASFWNVPDRWPGLLRAAEDRESYRDAAVASANATQAFDQLSAPGSVAVGQAYARALLTGSRSVTPTWELETRLALLGRADEPLLARVRALGVTHALLGNEARSTAAAEDTVSVLVRQHGQLLYAMNNWDLYELVPQPEPSGAVEDFCDEDLRGLGECWTGLGDQLPGLAAGEAPAGISQPVKACPGSVLSIRVQGAGQPGSAFRASVAQAGGLMTGYAYQDGSGSGSVTLNASVTSEAGAVVTVLPLSPAAAVAGVSIEVHGDDCD